VIICEGNAVWCRRPLFAASRISAGSYVRFALLMLTISIRSAERLSPAISSATLVMGAPRPQRICAARCALLSDISIFER
jgi:hypothetical protein